MNLIQIAAKKLTEQLLPEIEKEWKKFYHNASIDFPDIENDKEWERFWDCLGDHCGHEIEYLQEYIEEKWGYKIEIYQHGRGGATVYPELEGSCGRGYSRNLDLDKIVCWDDFERNEDEPEYCEWDSAYKQAKDYLEIFKFINEAARAEAKYIPEWWKDMKEANEWFEYSEDYKDNVEIIECKKAA